MPPIIYPLIVLVLIFILANYLMRVENQDKYKLADAFDTIKDDPKSINYLAYISDQPIWRMSLIGSLVGGIIFYILSAICLTATIIIFFIPNKTRKS